MVSRRQRRPGAAAAAAGSKARSSAGGEFKVLSVVGALEQRVLLGVLPYCCSGDRAERPQRQEAGQLQ